MPCFVIFFSVLIVQKLLKSVKNWQSCSQMYTATFYEPRRKCTFWFFQVRYKNYKNWLRLAKVIVKNKMSRFYGSVCIYMADTAKFLRRYVTMNERLELTISFLKPSCKVRNYWSICHLTDAGQIPQGRFCRKSYGIHILAQRASSDDWLLRAENTVTAVLCAELIKQLSSNQSKTPKESWYNASAHSSSVVMVFSDLSPSDFHQLLYLKDSRRGQTLFWQGWKCSLRAINDGFEQLEYSFRVDGVKALEDRWGKCVALNKDYVVKPQSDFNCSLPFLCFSHYLLINTRML